MNGGNQQARKEALLAAQDKALKLFTEIEKRNIICANQTEKTVNTAIYELAEELFGIKRYWHKRIVRAGKNTLCPYKENPPDLVIMPDDILFLDFGPIFEDWEADIGRTYVLGTDSVKLKLKQDVEAIWYEAKRYFENNADITGKELFQKVIELTEQRGFSFGQIHCGHLIGNFPHENIRRSELGNFINDDTLTALRAPDKDGKPRDWILEVHIVDKEKQVGAFFEQLLTC